MKPFWIFLLCFALTLALLLSILSLGAASPILSRHIQLASVTIEPRPSRIIAAAQNPTPILIVPSANGGTRIEGYTTAEGFIQVLPRGAEFGVRGQACVRNRGEQPTSGLRIVDQVQSRSSGGEFADVEGASITLLPQRQLNPGETECYPYEISLTPVAGATYRNAARATITNFSGWTVASTNCSGPAACEFGPLLVAGFLLPPPATATPPPTVIVLPSLVPSATPVTPACTTVPGLRSPAYGSTTRYTRVALDWRSVACASRYELVLRKDRSTGPVITQQTNLAASAYTTVPLARGRYYWQVRACSRGGCSNWSAIWYFFVAP